MSNDDDLEDFLKKVDAIDSIVRGLRSDDQIEVKKQLDIADSLILKSNEDNGEIECDGIKTRTVQNRTVINNSETTPSNGQQPSDQPSFLSFIEKDSNERYERRKQNERLADELKQKGNQEFKNLNYEKAVDYYTEGIQKIKDNAALYTNRAQANIKLEKYREAISDCEWALRVNENDLKAHIHKARALMYLKEYDSAADLFEKAKTISLQQKHAANIDDYLKELDRARAVDSQEKATKLFLETNQSSTDVKLTIEKIYKSNQIALYYAGGVRALASMLTDITQKTIFRQSDGFKLPAGHTFISKCLKMATDLNKLSGEEIDLLAALFDLFKIASSECDENIKVFFQIENIIDRMSEIINFKKSKKSSSQIDLLKISILEFIFQMSTNEYGRQLIFKHFPIPLFLLDLLSLLQMHCDNELLILNAAQCVQNLTADKNLLAKLKTIDKSSLSNMLDILNDPLVNHVKYSSNINQAILTVLSNLLTDNHLKDSIIEKANIWSALLSMLKSQNVDEVTLDRLLNIFINLCSKTSQALDDNYDKLVVIAYGLIEKFDEKSLMLIGNIIQNNKNALKQIKMDEFISRLILNIKSPVFSGFDFSESLFFFLVKYFKVLIVKKNEKQVKLSIKNLALCTQHHPSACQQLIKHDKSLNFLYKQFVDCATLDTKNNLTFKSNEILINNCVLCMSHCVDVDKCVADQLTRTNIVMDLLYLTRDLIKKEAQKSCAILLAKLTKQNEKHLIRLRELHGIEILHQALQNSNI